MRRAIALAALVLAATSCVTLPSWDAPVPDVPPGGTLNVITTDAARCADHGGEMFGTGICMRIDY